METSKNRTLPISLDSVESSSEDYDSSDTENRPVNKNLQKGQTISSSSEDSDNEIWNRPTNQSTKLPINVLSSKSDGNNTGGHITAAAVVEAKEISSVVIRPTDLPTSLSACSPGSASVETKNQIEKDVESRSEEHITNDAKHDSAVNTSRNDKHISTKDQPKESIIIEEELINRVSIISNDILPDKDIQAQKDIKMNQSDCSLPKNVGSISIPTNSDTPEDMDKFIENILHKYSAPEEGGADHAKYEHLATTVRLTEPGISNVIEYNPGGYRKGVLSTVVGSVVQNQSKVVRQLKTLAIDMDQVQEDLRGMMKDLNSKSSDTKNKSKVRGDAHSISRINRNEWLFEVDDNVALGDRDVRTYYQFVRDYSPIKILGSKYQTTNVDDDNIDNYYSRSSKKENKSRDGYQRSVSFDLGSNNRTSTKDAENDFLFPKISDDYWRRSKNDKRGYCYMCCEFECDPHSHSKTDASPITKNQTPSMYDRYEIVWAGRDSLLKNNALPSLETMISRESNDLTNIRKKSTNEDYLPKTKSKFLKKVQRRAMIGEKATPSEGFQSRFLKC